MANTTENKNSPENTTPGQESNAVTVIKNVPTSNSRTTNNVTAYKMRAENAEAEVIQLKSLLKEANDKVNGVRARCQVIEDTFSMYKRHQSSIIDNTNSVKATLEDIQKDNDRLKESYAQIQEKLEATEESLTTATKDRDDLKIKLDKISKDRCRAVKEKFRLKDELETLKKTTGNEKLNTDLLIDI